MENYRLRTLCFLLAVVLIGRTAAAAPLPNGDSQVSPVGDYDVKIGLQYRIMHNASNIPLSGVNTATDTDSYDFFRQRMRFNLDVQPNKEVGGFMQLEYRGGWGGTSPESSDPRGAGLSLNAFNRLEARGVRYGYVYYTPTDNPFFNSLSAGIIPISDKLGDTLFSADWDFNVGGAVLIASANKFDYRLGYVRLVDGIASSDSTVVGDDGHLGISDFTYRLSESSELSAHIYYFYGAKDLSVELGLEEDVINQGWYALSGQTKFYAFDLNSFFAVNNGRFAGHNNTGFAGKLEAILSVENTTLKLLGVYATGDDFDEDPDGQFRTLQGILGTEGYWSYTHLFTANAPSDVSDLGVGLENGGAGLSSVQAKLEVPVIDKLSIDVTGGWFYANAKATSGKKDMGVEFGTMLAYELAEYMTINLGIAYAFLGDFYAGDGESPDDLYEVFTRAQIQF